MLGSPRKVLRAASPCHAPLSCRGFSTGVRSRGSFPGDPNTRCRSSLDARRHPRSSNDMSTFADLGVSPSLVATLRARGIDAPFPIQALTVADGLDGRDLCGRAPTGSGKTLAFGIPLATRLHRAQPNRPLGLVLVPTRELAAQVSRELTWLGRANKLR